jgi:high-affinity nickel-transport protein
MDIALIVSAFAFGFRHGIDWDHIAAITDITSSQRDVRTGLRFASLYAGGHALVVFLIGILAIAAGETLPDSIDSAMGRVVGVTLLILGAYVLYALVRHGRDFRMRSRWMLVFQSARNAYRWVAARVGSDGSQISHEHAHSEDSFHHNGNTESNGGAVAVRTKTHSHEHTHDPFMNYGTGTSLAVGAMHGVGAETPTQVLIFLAAAGAGGAWAGVLTLAVFLVGLFAANSVLAVASASGYLAASRHFTVYATVSVVTAVASLVLGVSFVLGRDAWLPVFFGG